MIGERCQRAAPDEHRAERQRGGEGAEHASAAPAPFLALDDAEHESGDREREQQRSEQVGHAPPSGRAALDQPPAGEHDRGHADRDVDQEHQAPVRGRRPASRRATGRARRRPRRRPTAARRRGRGAPAGNAFSTSASEDGTRKAAPSACTTRNATSAPADGATAHSSEAAVNSSRPNTKMRRRPSRSAIRPAATRKAAKTML